MRWIRRGKGQSTLEYVAVFSVIVLAIAAAAYTALRPALEKLIDNSAARIEKGASVVLSQTPMATTTTSRSTSPSSTGSSTGTGGTSTTRGGGELELTHVY